MAYSLLSAGFDVKDVAMTDLISGRETLEEVNMIVFCGGFSNSDVLGSAKGWAESAFSTTPKLKRLSIVKFYAPRHTFTQCLQRLSAHGWTKSYQPRTTITAYLTTTRRVEFEVRSWD